MRNTTLDHASRTSSLDGKVAFITGATSAYGIGRVSADAMAAAGAFVFVTSRDPEKAATVVSEIEGNGGQAAFLRLDVMEESQWIAAMDEVRRRFGRLDILVNNAGNTTSAPIEDMSLETVWYMAHLNIEGALMGTTHAWPLLSQAGGVVLDINSGAGQRGAPGGTAYRGSKGALLALSMAAAVDGQLHGIRAISVHPGLTWTPGMERVPGREQYDRDVRNVPLGIGAESADIAAALVFLASDNARHITGIEYNIDGGSNAR